MKKRNQSSSGNEMNKFTPAAIVVSVLFFSNDRNHIMSWRSKPAWARSFYAKGEKQYFSTEDMEEYAVNSFLCQHDLQLETSTHSGLSSKKSVYFLRVWINFGCIFNSHVFFQESY